MVVPRPSDVMTKLRARCQGTTVGSWFPQMRSRPAGGASSRSAAAFTPRDPAPIPCLFRIRNAIQAQHTRDQVTLLKNRAVLADEGIIIRCRGSRPFNGQS